MTNVAVIGAQWGDEGKGKIVDWLAGRADVVVRFQGGHNAGHTLVVGESVYKLSLLPSGIVRPGKLSVIGNGVVIDPTHLISEIALLREQGADITPETLVVSDTAALILPLHQAVDHAREAMRGSGKIGTTGRGIGPAYEDKVARRAVRLGDLASEETLRAKLAALAAHHNVWLKAAGEPEADPKAMLDGLLALRDEIMPFAGQSWRVLEAARADGKRVLFEGAQGVMLDIDHGTYPFVTSSNTVAGQAATGAGTGPTGIGFVLGITKAYTTRVGSGPFPTEDFGADGDRMGERGREFGTVTGRKRRCGWFDAVMVRQANAVAGDHRHGADEAGCAGRVRDAEDLHRLRGGRNDAGPFPVRRGGAGRLHAGIRGDARLVRKHIWRPKLGRAAGQRGEIYPPGRGADPHAGDAAVARP